MPWCYVDDRFPEHPKVLLAGGDAGWLWLCGYSYVNRNLTDGFIPKAAVPRLSDRKNPTKLAARLVEVGLWEDKGDSYYMHDYDQFNQTAKDAVQKKAQRSEKARRAAEARWSNRDAQPPDEHQASNAQAVPDADATGMLGDAPPPQTPSPEPQAPLLTSHPETHDVGNPQPGPGGSATNGQQPTPLVNVVASSCNGNQRGFVLAEAAVVVDHLSRYVDRRLIEEAAGQARERGANLPRWLLPVVRSRADSLGIKVPVLRQLEHT